MNILVNCANLKKGGGIQVADSVCCQLGKYPDHHFVVVLPSYMEDTFNRLNKQIECGKMDNVAIERHTIFTNMGLLLTRHDRFMDDIVEKHKIDVVLSIFGPSLWAPKAPHLCGFARPHIVLTDSPYFKRMTNKVRMKSNALHRVLQHYFDKGTDALWAENPMISGRLAKLMPKKKIFTITNYYNQVFDNPGEWKPLDLPAFEGATFLSVNAPYDHKNMEIAIEAAKHLKNKYPDFKFRFVFTFDETDYPTLNDELKPHFLFLGKVDIAQVPSLYLQADVMFQPTLLECFTATYPEAMRMKVPIVTTDLDFARGLCDEAAIYYSPLDAVAAAETLYKTVTDRSQRECLIQRGEKQLAAFDNYEQRAKKLIDAACQLA